MKDIETLKKQLEKELPQDVYTDLLTCAEWETEKKNYFVQWVCEAIAYNSSQGDTKTLDNVTAMYTLYLKLTTGAGK